MAPEPMDGGGIKRRGGCKVLRRKDKDVMTWRDKLELGIKNDAALRKDNLPESERHGAEEAAAPGRSPVVAEKREEKEQKGTIDEKAPARNDERD